MDYEAMIQTYVNAISMMSAGWDSSKFTQKIIVN